MPALRIFTATPSQLAGSYVLPSLSSAIEKENSDFECPLKARPEPQKVAFPTRDFSTVCITTESEIE